MPLGTYLPSYFEIKIDTPLSLSNVYLLPKKEKGAYYHEYLHFLQDVTTTFGLLKTWNAYDRLRQLIVSIQHEKGEIILPLQNAEQELQEKYLYFLSKLQGSSSPNVHPELDKKFEIKEIQLVEDPLIQEIIPGVDARHVHLLLFIPGTMDKAYRFGERAISESMAYLAESRFFQLEPPPKFPYMVAGEVARFVLPPLAENAEFIFALCDVSLMHPLPGWAFFQLLLAMKAEGYQATTGADIIDYGLEKYLEWGWDVRHQMETAVQGILHVTKAVYPNPHFAKTLGWFQTIIARGCDLRLKMPYFFIDIFKDSQAIGEKLSIAWSVLGGPQCVNSEGLSFMKMPGGLEDNESETHPQHLLISSQLNKFLLDEEIPCRLQPVCSQMKSEVPVDQRCEDHPWERAKDEWGCPYASAWAMYGFDKLNFIMNGQPLQK